MAAGAAASAEPPCPPGGGEAVVAAEVLRGDTVRLTDGRLVRLAGIDVPLPPTDDSDGARLAEEARARLARLVEDRPVTMALEGKAVPDRHARIPAYLLLPTGNLVQAAMLAEGHARARWLPGEETCFPQFRDAETPARVARKGLWASPLYATTAADHPSLAMRNGLYQLVEGRVVSVGHGFRMIFLDFGRNFRRDFTVMVPPSVAEAMAAAGSPADVLLNRRIRVRGVLEESGGPAIRLNHPAEIEVLD